MVDGVVSRTSSYLGKLKTYREKLKERVQQWNGEKIRCGIEKLGLTHHHDPDYLALSDLFVLQDIEEAESWSKGDFVRTLDLILEHCRFHCICVDDQREQLENLLEDVDVKACLPTENFAINVVEYDPRGDFVANFERIKREVLSIQEDCHKPGQDVLLFLLDVNLGGDHPSSGITLGQDLQRAVQGNWPDALVFALTRHREIHVILGLGQLGADAFIYKPSLVLLPLYITRFHQQRLGSLVWGLGAFSTSVLAPVRKPDLPTLSMLRSHILLWERIPETLWFGDRVPILIDHSLEHSRNLWKLTQDLFEAAPEACDRVLCNDPLLFQAFLLAIWLHDIGHKGDFQHQDPPGVRAAHGSISARLICRRPDLYLPYLGKQTDGTAELLVEYICAFCRYHSSAPLNEQLFEELRQEGKLLRVFEMSELPLLRGKEGQLIAPKLPLTIKEERLSGKRYVLLADRLLPAVALFRLIDSLDVQANRAGTSLDHEVKLDTVRQQMVFLQGKLRELSDRMELEFVHRYPHFPTEAKELHEKMLALDNHLDAMVSNHEKLCDRRSRPPISLWSHPAIILGVSYLINEQETVGKRHIGDIEKIGGGVLTEMDLFKDWRVVLDYLLMLSLREKYLHLHLSFLRVTIKKGSAKGLAVVYTLSRSFPANEKDQALYVLHTSFFCKEVVDYVRKEWVRVKSILKSEKHSLDLSEILFEFGNDVVVRFAIHRDYSYKEVLATLFDQLLPGQGYTKLALTLEGTGLEFLSPFGEESEALRKAVQAIITEGLGLVSSINVHFQA